jgi:hypothetical protein
MTTPRIVTPQEWQKEWQRLLVKEKEMTRARDATIIISCRLSFSVADTGSPTCRFAEFSSKWRTASSHLRGGSYNRTVVHEFPRHEDRGLGQPV